MSRAERVTRHLLLVEDNRDDCARIHRMLRDQRRSYQVVDCASGEEGLSLLATGRAFDCVLLDHRLGDMTGDTFLERLRTSTGHLPAAVCVLTGVDDDDTAAKVLELGAEDYLLKDEVTPHALVRAIENVIERFAIRRQVETQRAALDLRNVKLEAMRMELESRLIELSEATRARDRFVAMMSHEMRTPLNAILGYSELLEMEIEGQMNDAQRRNLERIRVGSRHLLDLINNVLDLARADARKLELDLRPVDVRAAIEEVVALLENEAAQKKLTLQFPRTDNLPLAIADLQRLRQIMTNLVGNAIKFTDHGGITITATPADGGASVAIAVSDSGIGISPEAVRDVFKEFYQADDTFTRVHGGSGLGLAIAQRLARAMHGDIAVASTPGKGSVFTLTLPTAEVGSETRAEDTAAHGARMARVQELENVPGPEPVSVVAFADDAAALGALERQVRPGVRLRWTIEPAEVPSLAAQEAASLVILDISAREGASWRVAQTVNDAGLPIPPAILLLPRIIAHAPSPGSTAVDLGWVALVPKPFTSDQLTRAVTAAAGRAPDEEPATTYDVLVIDDDADSRRVASRFLREKGVKVRESVDGETGLAEMRIRPPDVAVLDLMMPVLDGFGVLATMRADPLLAGIPVVVLTAKTLTEAERKFLTRTAVRVLQKGEHRLSDIAALVVRAAVSARAAQRK